MIYLTAFGLQVESEDNVLSGMEAAAVVLVRLACFSLAAVEVVAVLRIALQG